MHPQLKICGMCHAANIAEVAKLLPDYMGFIFYGRSPRAISDVSSELIKYVPSSIKTTGVFVNEEIDIVKATVVKCNIKAVQLHGNESPSYCESVKSLGVEVMKAFGIDEHFDFSRLKAYVNAVDYFLFDTQTASHGGSGKVFDWDLLQNYEFDKPYFLSGGIDLIHIADIKLIEDPRLYAIDVNSRFEVGPGLKDVEKLRQLTVLLNAS